MSAQSRASLALRATTTLAPDAALALVKVATGNVKGGGASLLTTGLQNVGARVHVEREQAGKLELSINSGKRIVELCTFTAAATTANGMTNLQVGGLARYKTSQSTVLGFIPVGPKQIAAMSPYKRFLEAVAAVIRETDPTAQVTVAETVS